MITVSVNGQQRELPRPINVCELLTTLDLAGKRVAVERNGEIVPRSRLDDVRLQDGDTLEIVIAVGGG